MKEKEVKVENKGIVITKEMVISCVIGVFLGALITSCVFCTCRRPHFPSAQENQMQQTHERVRPTAPRNFDKQAKRKQKTQTNETNETTENTTSNN